MKRRTALRTIALAGLSPALGMAVGARTLARTDPAAPVVPDRTLWLDALLRIASPVLEHLAAGTLRARMPVDLKPGSEHRQAVAHLEAFGRTMAGIAPWLECEGLTGAEAEKQQHFRALATAALRHAVDPGHPDYLNFYRDRQALVDTAFLAHALVRAPKTFAGAADAPTRARLADALRSSRVVTPHYSNWLLFSAMVEMGLMVLGEEWDRTRVELALHGMASFYKGDGAYGDGSDFHWDYYNSFVIQPFMLDVLDLIGDSADWLKRLKKQHLEAATRYGVVLERMISPEGTYPPIGRSLAYRFGAFQLLAQLALQHRLDSTLRPGVVRSALTAVISRIMEAPGLFDSDGWLRIGLMGAQPSIGEGYITTGSLYLCTAVFLPLGLSPNDPFWSDPAGNWTAHRIWNGEDVLPDHSL